MIVPSNFDGSQGGSNSFRNKTKMDRSFLLCLIDLLLFVKKSERRTPPIAFLRGHSIIQSQLFPLVLSATACLTTLLTLVLNKLIDVLCVTRWT